MRHCLPRGVRVIMGSNIQRGGRMAQLYEYDSLTCAGLFAPSKETIDDEGAFNEHVDLWLSTWMDGRLPYDLEEHKGGGWEVVSHSLMRYEKNLVLTFVIRRPKS